MPAIIYTGVLILTLGIVFTFLDIMQMDIVQDFIYKQFWHAMAFMVISFFYISRLINFLFREAKHILRDLTGYKSYEERLEEENLNLKIELEALHAKN